ncbi:sensor histidine kinase [Isoptericola aurantiacus]|uniref:sensor histidine kinase n=1 Tax=Isoptericola aurantiacus TaxID=3377839 RepID=UPI00383B6352
MTQDRRSIDRPSVPSRAGAVGLLAVAVVAAATAGGVALTTGGTDLGGVAGDLFALTLAVLGTLVVLRGDPVRYGWLMLAAGTTTVVLRCAAVLAPVATADDLPGAAAAVWTQDLFPVTFLLVALLLPALFPDGSAASPGRGRAVVVTAAGWVLYVAWFALVERPAQNVFFEAADPPPNPLGVLEVPDDVLAALLGPVWLVLVVASVVVAVGSLVTRWRRATGTTLRRQIATVAVAFGVVLVLTATAEAADAVGATLGVGLGLSAVLHAAAATAAIALALLWGAAVLRYRLHDVPRGLRRTAVYGLLTALLLIVYAGVVALAATLAPDRLPAAALLAAVVVAVLVEPARRRLQAVVTRMLYGQRDDPVAVLSRLGRHLADAGTSEQTLATIVRTVSESLHLAGAAVEATHPGRTEVLAHHGALDETAADVALRDAGELVGHLVVAPRRPGEDLTPADLALLESVAGPIAAVVRSARLTTALRDSRERLVVAREEERRRIRRDLHDGLGPSLAAQTFQLDEALALLPRDPERAALVVTAVKERNRELVGQVRQVVDELRPRALDELGLADALRSHAALLAGGRLDVEVQVDPVPLPALPAAVEAAAFHIVREAVTNAARHASAGACQVSLRASGGHLRISVHDDGHGVASRATSGRPGVGLTSMRERAEELGGRLEITQPDGLEVVARLPLRPAGAPDDEEDDVRGR